MPKKRKAKFDLKKYAENILKVLENFKTLIPEEKRVLKVLSNKKTRGRRQSAS